MRETLERVLSGEDLKESEAEALLLTISQSEPQPALTAAFLTGLRMKGETPAEVRGFARAMRRLARRPLVEGAVDAVDIVGTGGDRSGSYNISTAAALLTAACDVPVVKHGNRSISSQSGSADVLEELGMQIPLDESAAGAMLKATNFTFLFAPYYHPAMATLAPIRREIGVRTVFNILGPLTNPAEPGYYVLGAFSSEVAQLMAEALAGLDVRRAFVVHGSNGWDEATPVCPFELFSIEDGHVTRSVRSPEQYGVAVCSPEDLLGGDAAGNAVAIRRVFEGERGAHHDAIVMGAALALEVTGRCPDAGAAASLARARIDDGSAMATLDALALSGKQSTLQ